MKKLILFFIAGPTVSGSQIDMAKSIGAQIRNPRLVNLDSLEKPDFVAGEVPDCYKDVPVFPTAAEMTERMAAGSATQVEPDSDASGTAQDDLEPDTGDNPGDDQEEAEITAEYLESLKLEELVKLAEENEVTLTAKEKKSKAKALASLMDAFELQE